MLASGGRGAILLGLCVLLGSLAPARREAWGREPSGPGRGGGRVEELAGELKDRDSAVRRRAVRELSELGDRKAWELVIGALSDPKGEVADEAQFQLAGLDEPRLLKQLYGREGLSSKDDLVRERVAEVFGRCGLELDGDDLLRAVSRRDPRMSEALLWSIERLASAQRLGGDLTRCGRDLAKLARQSGDARVRAEALCALAAVDAAQLPDVLRQLFEAKEHELRIAALECAVRAAPEQALEIGRRLCADEHSGVRLAALEAIAAAGTKASLEILVERLEIEKRLRLQVACVEFLQQLSARKDKLDPRPWRLWITGLPDDWTVSDRVAGRGDVGGTASLAGLPILSDRVCFLIDFSGSLWYEREGRPARKGKVDELLRAALPRLGAETEFNIIPYTGVPHPWREQLVPASPRNVGQALADFEANREKGSGNVFDAVLLALSDPRVDRIVILTDGAPTGGARWKLELMMPLLEQAARFSRVTYDVIVVDARPGLRKQWTSLAERTGGRALAVEL